MTFADGIIVKTHTFPDGGEVIKLSFKVEEFKEFAEKHKNGEWLNVEIKTSQKTGNKYAALDEWKPKAEQAPKVEDIPFDDLP